MQKLVVSLKGMSCEHCVETLKQALEKISGVKALSVAINSVQVVLDETQVKARDVIASIRSSTSFEVVSFQLEPGA